ncbi:iron complex outermembrane recepter protein [Sphingomonas guangdongensis]|uniref:Iron complex outermembrane recepter protein n=1 Tax=Sphingomonas guangdongensis TaxID=1141890 RepID=A0A285R231_9SPHN|nr:TonB-dependent receptor [Sphingomonas guangdongensis]SOB86402.1 iron complex outermembrane recepter protein [Sphingomonas guangdongensis]
MTIILALAAQAAAPLSVDTDRPAIIVTGRQLEAAPDVAGRLGLTNRETPAIIDVVTQEDFQNQGVRSAIEAMNAAPGVTSGNLPGSIGSVSLRGFTRAVNYLHDGVRMANSDVGVRDWDAWMFERIEVIKGPASVTSGDGALAGAINFVPRRPRLGATGGEALASYGSFGTGRLALDLNVPLGAAAALRGDVAVSRSSGWIDDTDSRTLAASGSVFLQPTARWSMTLSADWFQDDFDTAYFGTPVVSRAVARDPSNAVGGSAGLVLDRAMRRVNFDVTDANLGSDTLWLRARGTFQAADGVQVVSDSSFYDSHRDYRDADEYGFNAATGGIDRGLTAITHDHRFWNQRLHLAVDRPIAGLRNRVTIGAEFGHTDFFTTRRFGSTPSIDPFRPVRGTFPADTPASFATRQDVTADVDQLAVFAEEALNLSDAWLLVGGLRYDHVALNRRVATVTTGAVQRYGRRYDPLSWRVGSVYSLTPATQVFAQYTRAVTPVGGLLFLSAANAAFDQTTGRSYEVGIKTSLVGGGVELTASLFDIRQDDIITRDPTNPALSVQGGDLRSRGGEVSLSLPVTRALRVAASGTLLDAAYGTLVEAGGVSRAGNRPPNVPERVADLVVTYAPAMLPVTLTASARHNGDFYTSNANTVRVNAYTTFDAAIAWRASFGTVTLRGRNLSDAFYADWSGYAAGLVFVGAPRSVELSLTRRF